MLQSRSIVFDETIVDGFEQLPSTLNMLFEELNTGKLLVRVGR